MFTNITDCAVVFSATVTAIVTDRACVFSFTMRATIADPTIILVATMATSLVHLIVPTSNFELLDRFIS